MNETEDLAQIQNGIELDFNAVMVESDRLAPDEYRHLVKQFVRFAHGRNVSVEAQPGRPPNGCEAGDFTALPTLKVVAAKN